MRVYLHNTDASLLSFVVTEARNLARRLGCAFIETSAKERINVDEAFIALVREIKRSQQVCSTLSRSLPLSHVIGYSF